MNNEVKILFTICIMRCKKYSREPSISNKVLSKKEIDTFRMLIKIYDEKIFLVKTITKCWVRCCQAADVRSLRKLVISCIIFKMKNWLYSLSPKNHSYLRVDLKSQKSVLKIWNKNIINNFSNLKKYETLFLMTFIKNNVSCFTISKWSAFISKFARIRLLLIWNY